MIRVQYMRPFYTKVTPNGKKLRLIFAYQYFSIMKEDESFHFIPIEGREIVFNLETKQVENLSEVFVFQRGNRFMRLPLYQLLLVSDVNERLSEIIENTDLPANLPMDEVELDEETTKLVNTLEIMNIDKLIDEALDERNEEKFFKLLEEKKKLETEAEPV